MNSEGQEEVSERPSYERVSNVSLPRMAAWVEGRSGVDGNEARRIVTSAYRRYGRAIARAFKRGQVALDLRERNRCFRIELSMLEEST
jgi:hypothetical protein